MNNCLFCGEETENKKYCSLICYHSMPISELTRAKLKGHPSPNKGKKYSIEYRKELSLAHVGIPSKMKGKKASVFAIQRNSESHKGLVPSEESNKKRSIRMKEVWKNQKYAKIISERVSARKKKDWKDPIFAMKMFVSFGKTPNKPESLLNALLLKNFPGEWKYVGDGSFVINGKNPDFVNINGKKQVIELFGDYWHRNDDGDNRKALFREYGFDTLIIWEHELKFEEAVIQKISSFCQRRITGA